MNNRHVTVFRGRTLELKAPLQALGVRLERGAVLYLAGFPIVAGKLIVGRGASVRTGRRPVIDDRVDSSRLAVRVAGWLP